MALSIELVKYHKLVHLGWFVSFLNLSFYLVFIYFYCLLAVLSIELFFGTSVLDARVFTSVETRNRLVC